jgi:MFS family permease
MLYCMPQSPDQASSKESSLLLRSTGPLDLKYGSASLGVFLVEFAVFVPITYITSYALHVGFSEEMSYAIIVFLNLGAFFGRFLSGLVADRLGRFNVMSVNCLTCALTTFILWLPGDLVAPSNLGILIGYAVLFGFWSGAAISLAPVCISQVCDQPGPDIEWTLWNRCE